MLAIETNQQQINRTISQNEKRQSVASQKRLKEILEPELEYQYKRALKEVDYNSQLARENAISDVYCQYLSGNHKLPDNPTKKNIIGFFRRSIKYSMYGFDRWVASNGATKNKSILTNKQIDLKAETLAIFKAHLRGNELDLATRYFIENQTQKQLAIDYDCKQPVISKRIKRLSLKLQSMDFRESDNTPIDNNQPIITPPDNQSERIDIDDYFNEVFQENIIDNCSQSLSENQIISIISARDWRPDYQLINQPINAPQLKRDKEKLKSFTARKNAIIQSNNEKRTIYKGYHKNNLHAYFLQSYDLWVKTKLTPKKAPPVKTVKKTRKAHDKNNINQSIRLSIRLSKVNPVFRNPLASAPLKCPMSIITHNQPHFKGIVDLSVIIKHYEQQIKFPHINAANIARMTRKHRALFKAGLSASSRKYLGIDKLA